MSESDVRIELSAANAQLVSSLITARAALDAALLMLTQESLPKPPAAPVPATAAGSGVECKHENRKDVRTFGSAEHWICPDCGYEYRR